MANNPQAFTRGSVLMVDPNPPNNELVSSEDLNIIVELETINKPRSAINVIRENDILISSNNPNSVKVNFINGTDINGKKSLTTNYTEIGSDFGVQNDDLETFGITSIDIDFNTSYAPVVKIDFTDIRGRLFELGSDSPYKVFFTLPYPIFKLKIKGYYGKSVTYCLHLVNFNAEFDSKTGNFNIVGEFIGYTYALLSDMLLGYLKAIPETSFGNRIIKDSDNDFIKLNELTERVGKFNNEIGNLKQDNVKIQELATNEDIKIQLVDLRTIINNSLSDLFYKNNGFNNNEGFVFLRQPTNTNESDTINGKLNVLRNKIENSIKVFNNGTPDNLRLSDSEFNIINYSNLKKSEFKQHEYTGNNPSIIGKVELIEEINQLFLRESRIGPEQNLLVLNITQGISRINEYIELIEKNIEDLKVDVSIEIQTKIAEIFGFEPGVKNFIKILTEHVELLLKSIQDVSVLAEKNLDERLRLVRRKGDFSDINENASIFAFPEYTKQKGNGVVADAWLGNDFPSFPEVRLVEELLEGLLLSKKRDNEILSSLINKNEGWYPVNPLDTPIFGQNDNPWLEIKNGSTVDVLRLLLLRATTFLSHSNTNLSNDEILTMARLEANNAFNSIENRVVKDGINYYKTDNPTNITNEVLAQSVNRNTSVTGTTLKTAPPYDFPPFLNDELSNNQGGIFKLFNSSTGFVDVGDPDPNTFYEYVYISGEPTLTNDEINRKYYIPLNKPFDGSNLSNLTDSQRIDLRDNGDMIFLGNYIGANSSDENERVDDGATYLKIIDLSEYKDNIYNLPNYGLDILDDYKLRSNFISQKEINSESDNVYNIFSNKYGITEFFNYNLSDGTGSAPVWSLFYDNYDLHYKGVIFSERKKVEKSSDLISSEFDIPEVNYSELTIPNPNYDDYSKLTTLRNYNHINNLLDYSKSQSTVINTAFLSYNSRYRTPIFGSHFYYQQSSEQARALLFLHSLPYNGMISSTLNNGKGLFRNDVIKGLFNKRSGFINVPKPWILFVGGLLWRTQYKDPTTNIHKDPIVYKYTGTINTEFSLIKGINADELILPTTKQYLTVYDGKTKTEGFSFNGAGTSGEYVDIENILLQLPTQTKNEFIQQFLSWVDSTNGWLKIKENGEIFDSTALIDDIIEFWTDFDRTNVVNNLSNSILKDDFILNYGIFGKDNLREVIDIETSGDTQTEVLNRLESKGTTSTPFNFLLEIRDGSLLNKNINDLLVEQQVIANSTWRIWADNDLEGFIIDDRIDAQAPPHRVLTSKMGDYVRTFMEEFVNLNQNFRNNTDEEDELKRQLFNTINNDDIKISIYKNIKSIYDKWVCGADNIISFCGTDTNNNKTLIDSFRFIDRAFNDISDEFKINPIDLTKLIESNYNQSFYDFVSTLLRDNNFDFIPLPTYIDYNDEEAIKDVFRTYSYSEDVSSSGPQFVCMYIGERSSRLDLEGSDYTDSAVNFRPDNDEIPTDFTTGGTTPVVLVNYSSQNQSIFKDLKLNQKEFTETNESLWITDEISRRGAPTNRTALGQNLYQIYLTRSYSCTVEAMGNAQIQPFMYFQLNNVPMFRGGYAIIHVNHKIVPHNMRTFFKGVRIKKPRTALIKDDSIYINLVGSLSDINTNDFNLEDSNLARARGGQTKNINDNGSGSNLSNFITAEIVESLGLKIQPGEPDVFVIREIKEILEQISLDYYNLTHNESYGDSLYINDFSKRYGGKLKSHTGHDRGVEGDIRPIINSKLAQLTSINQANYYREGTILLIQTIIDVSNRKGVPVEKIYFNDPFIINLFPDLVINVSGHDDHIHVIWTVPKRVLESINNGNLQDDNFDEGVLKKIPLLERGNKQTRINSLGQI